MNEEIVIDRDNDEEPEVLGDPQPGDFIREVSIVDDFAYWCQAEMYQGANESLILKVHPECSHEPTLWRLVPIEKEEDIAEWRKQPPPQDDGR
jgi:hypothetical protein